jgi:hypothetical protein
MALRYFGIEGGQPDTTVTDASSTTSKDIELVVDLAASLNLSQVLDAVERIKDYITRSAKWPPA